MLGPGAPAGAAPGPCAALRWPPPGFGPPRLSPPSLLRGGLAVVGGARSGRVAPPLPLGRSGGLGLPPPRLRPSPGSARPPAPRPLRVLRAARAGSGPLVGWGRPWPAPCSLWSPCAALRPPPPPSGPSRVPPALHPLRVPSVPSGGRPPGVRAPPAGRGWRPCGPPFRLRPARRVGGVPLSGQPGKGQARRPEAALAWLTCLRQVVSKPPKGGLTSSNTCATMMGQGRPALHRQPCAGRRPWWRAGAFFASPSRPPPSGGEAQGHGDAAHPPPSATGGDEGTKRGVRTKCPHPSGVSWSPVRTQQNGPLFC